MFSTADSHYFFFCKQTGQNGNCCTTMIKHLIFIKCFRERRTIQIDVWNKFLTLAVPQMFADIGYQLFFLHSPISLHMPCLPQLP